MKNIDSYDPERHAHSYNYKQDCKKSAGGGGGDAPEVGAVITAFSGPSRPVQGATYKGAPNDKQQSAAVANSQGSFFREKLSSVVFAVFFSNLNPKFLF